MGVSYIYMFLKHTTAKLLVYRLTYTSCSYRFWFHLFCFSYSHGLVMLVLCIMFLLLHTSAYSCFLWHSLVYSIVPCCHILKWGVVFVSFIAKRFNRMQKSDFLQANWWILKSNEYFCTCKYKYNIIYSRIVHLTYIIV